MAFVSPSIDSLALPAPSLVEAGVKNESVAEASFCFIEVPAVVSLFYWMILFDSSVSD